MPAARLPLLLLLLSLWLGQALAAGVQTLQFERLGRERLNLQGSLQCGLQDDLGRIWLGSSEGLVLWDGRQARRFESDPRRADTLSHPFVQDLLWQDDGRLLVATAGGLNRLEPRSGRVERIELPDARTQAQRAVMGMVPATAGRIWLQQHYRLLWFEPASARLTPVPLPDDLTPVTPNRPPILRSAQTDGAGGLWLTAGQELLHLDAQGQIRARWRFPKPPPGQTVVRSMVLDAQGRAWIGGEGWLHVLDTRDGRLLDLPQRLGLPADVVYMLLRDSQNAIWLGMGRSGLWRWRPGDQRAESFAHHPADAHSPASNAIASLFEDRNHTLWVGGREGTVSLADVRAAGLRQYRQLPGEADSLGSDAVLALAPEGAQSLWVGTQDRGLFRLDLASGQAQALDTGGLPIHLVRALRHQPGVGLWIGAQTGLYLLPEGARQPQAVDLQTDDPSAHMISSLALQADGTLWVGSQTGLFRRSPQGQLQRLRQFGPQPALPSEEILSLSTDRQDRLWVGSSGGLFLQVADRFVPALAGAPELALERLKVHALREDGAGRLWMASPLGLFELEPLGPQQWRPRLRGDAVAGPIWNLELDAAEGLWLAGSQGLSRLAPDRRQLQHRAGLGGRLQVGAASGASARGPDGALYFGSPGVLRVEPAALPPPPAAAPVLLADLRVFNRSLSSANAQPRLAELGVDGPLERARSLQLSHREAMVSFELRAQQFLGAERVRYAWKLTGFDRDWIEGEPGQGLATYTNLDPGRYQLWVRSAHPDGDWGEPQRLLDVAVAPPWWRSLPFRTLLLALLVAGVVLAWRLRVSHLRATQRRLESEVARRTAEVQAQRQQIGVLSEIGRELTANLDPLAVRQALIGHLAALLPANCFGLGLVNREEAVVEFGLVMDQGRAFRPYRRRLDAQEQPAARCVATGEPLWLRELEHDNRQVDSAQRQQDDEWLQMEDGGPPSRSRSALYVPLKVKGEVLGVLAALSPAPDAFSQTHLDMLQTLAAYAAVALDNAAAYKQLQQAQAQLVEQRKLAALGHLVAGVAHELNTPLGNSLLAASTLCEEGRRLGHAVSQGQLRKSDLNQYLQTLEGCGSVLLQSLETASRLVVNFKQLAVDRNAEPRRRFGLQALVDDLRTTRAEAIRQAGQRLEVQLPAGLELDSYPDALRQVLEQLVDNALEHGLAGRQGGCLRLHAEAAGPRQLRLRFSDDGLGIAPEHLGRVFDPFYTTRFGCGSNGLGLHLVHALVSSLLGGQISVRSEPGQGAEFEILLPLSAPRDEG